MSRFAASCCAGSRVGFRFAAPARESAVGVVAPPPTTTCSDARAIPRINQPFTLMRDGACEASARAALMFGLFGRNDRPLLITTIKAVAAIGVLSLLAANYLADGLDQSGLTRLAASASKAREPAITGSINKVKLDPCATPR